MKNKFVIRTITGFCIAALIAITFFILPMWMFTALLFGITGAIIYEWRAIAPNASLLSWVAYPLFPCTLLIIGSQLPLIRPFVGLLFYIVFIHDTSAYIIGSLFGKNRLAPHISPHKTWEGFAGGCAGVIIGLQALMYYNALPHINMLTLILISCAIAAVATTGDLYISWYKRKAGIKDTGTLLPGHGGILDRCDSLLACAYALPFVMMYYYFG